MRYSKPVFVLAALSTAVCLGGSSSAQNSDSTVEWNLAGIMRSASQATFTNAAVNGNAVFEGYYLVDGRFRLTVLEDGHAVLDDGREMVSLALNPTDGSISPGGEYFYMYGTGTVVLTPQLT